MGGGASLEEREDATKGGERGDGKGMWGGGGGGGGGVGVFWGVVLGGGGGGLGVWWGGVGLIVCCLGVDSPQEANGKKQDILGGGELTGGLRGEKGRQVGGKPSGDLHCCRIKTNSLRKILQKRENKTSKGTCRRKKSRVLRREKFGANHKPTNVGQGRKRLFEGVFGTRRVGH